MLAAMSPSGILSLIFGYGMNTVFGMIAGLYLTFLAEHGSPSSYGIIFGAGYGAGSILSYIISLAEKGSFLQDPKVFILYAVIFIITVPLSVSLSDTDSPIRHPSPQSVETASMLWLPGITILLLSCVKSGGFYFPVEDLGNNIIHSPRSFGNIIHLCRGFDRPEGVSENGHNLRCYTGDKLHRHTDLQQVFSRKRLNLTCSVLFISHTVSCIYPSDNQCSTAG